MGGDGTMLGIARQLAPYDVPLIGINQGRLGFMTDIPLERMLPALAEILSGKSEAEKRTLLEGRVMRDGDMIFSGLAVNDVVVARGAGAGMVELQVDGRRPLHVQPALRRPDRRHAHRLHRLRAVGRRPAAAPEPARHRAGADRAARAVEPADRGARPSEIVIEIVAGRDTSVNFDMQSFASLAHGDQIVISRSPNHITFLHPEGWSYYDTLREKLHWNEYPSVEGKLR